MTEIFAARPKQILNYPKFSNFRLLQWWDSPKFAEISSGLIKLNCYKYP